ncbi:MAG: DinB family protein [Armatimonadetes bacterium]|nr:DinB family protein [Armatimonadota bacterium]
MAATVDDLLEGVRRSRAHFLKHLEGLTDEQYDWKPYAECKAVRETLTHLLWVDRAALDTMETGQMPTSMGIEVEDSSLPTMVGLLEESHRALVDYIAVTYQDAPLDAPNTLWGDDQKLINAVPYLASEDYYHAGQVAYVRLATDPAWDYYAQIYGVA